MPRKRAEWWERSMDIYFRKKRDPKKLLESISRDAREIWDETIRFSKEFHEDVEKIRERLFGGKKVVK